MAACSELCRSRQVLEAVHAAAIAAIARTTLRQSLLLEQCSFAGNIVESRVQLANCCML